MALARSPGSDEVAPARPAVWREGPLMVVALRGEQDASTATRVAEAIAGAAALGHGDVVVDLSGVQFMDATIVGAMVQGRNELRPQARHLTVRVPSPRARAVLELCDLEDLIDPIPSTMPVLIGSCVTVRGLWSPNDGSTSEADC